MPQGHLSLGHSFKKDGLAYVEQIKRDQGQINTR